MKSVSWQTQHNPTSPNEYSRVHIVKVERPKWVVCYCGTTAYDQPEIEIRELKKDVKELYEQEKEDRKNKGYDPKGLYCLKCLKKAMEEGK